MSSIIFQLFTNIGKFIIFDKNTYKYSNESREEIIIFLKNIDEITNKYFNEYLENFVMVTCLEVALKYKKNIDEKKENKNEILSSIKTGMESFTEKDYINNDKIKEIFAKSQEKMINDLQRKIEDFTFKKGCIYITDNYINKLIEEKIKLYENEILNNNLIIEKKIRQNIIDLSNNVNEIINFYK